MTVASSPVKPVMSSARSKPANRQPSTDNFVPSSLTPRELPLPPAATNVHRSSATGPLASIRGIGAAIAW